MYLIAHSLKLWHTLVQKDKAIYQTMLRRRLNIGQLDELKISTEPSAAAGFAVLSLILAQVARRWFHLRPSQAFAGGLLGAAFHFFSEFWHQLGHARAARHVGYPMRGIHFWGALAASRYPHEEEELPPDIHIARALGGPQASLMLTIVAGALALLARPLGGGGLPAFLTSFLAIDNLLVFTLGALTPLPFFETDGVTILRQLRRNRPRNFVLSE
jgi:hypothetical protein